MNDSRHEEMRRQCQAFHEENPLVWELFVRFTRERIARGFKSYSADAIFHRIRWETDQADVDGRSTFKINNNFTAFYARRFMNTSPDYDGFFRTRVQTSMAEPASNLPPLGPEDFD